MYKNYDVLLLFISPYQAFNFQPMHHKIFPNSIASNPTKCNLGLCGAFCTMCKFSQKAAQKHAEKGEEFKIDRHIDDLHELANHLKKVKDKNGKRR